MRILRPLITGIYLISFQQRIKTNYTDYTDNTTTDYWDLFDFFSTTD